MEEFARRRGKSPADALDEALANYLEWEQQDVEEAVQGIQQGYDDVRAGRTRPADELIGDLARSLAFRVEVSAQAERDAEEILDWLLTHHSERPGIDGFWLLMMPSPR